MNVFTDFHHQGLMHSLKLLFEDRLGGNLYRPIGMEWATEGYWHVYDHPDTQKQFLMDGYIPKDGTPPLNGTSRIQDGIHYIKDTTHGGEQKAITLEQFKEMDIDIVIASIPAHIEPYKKLIHEFKPKAKFVFQQGNMFTEVLSNLHTIPNLLSSTIEFPVPPSCHAVFYHQEFPVDIFKPNFEYPKKKITSFINLLPKTNHGPFYYILDQILPEYECKSYGILCDNGIISGIENIATIMKSSMWGFHAKWGGDGFGHILYNWYAAGKPVITSISDYKDKLGGELLEDGVTCIDIDRKNHEQVADSIRTMSESHYTWMAQQAYQRFCEKVNYNEEEQKIREWLGGLL